MVINTYYLPVVVFTTAITMALLTTYLNKTYYAPQVHTPPESVVTLVATVDQNPAMRPVSWQIYRLTDNRLVYSSDRHTNVVQLPPDHYRLKLSYQSKQLEQQFTINAGQDTNLIIPLD